MQTTPKWQPTAQQQRFHDALRQMGCIISGEMVDTELHHVLGASGRHDKVWIGQWWVLMLSRKHHRQVTKDKNAFELQFDSQKNLFKTQVLALHGMVLIGRIKFDLNDLPPLEVMAGVENYNLGGSVL